MKNFYLNILFSLLYISVAISVTAQTECSTIAEIKKQSNNTIVKYIGNATTTYYGPNGIMIMDGTGAIYLRAYELSELVQGDIKPNMTITNIKGIYTKTDDFFMSKISIEGNDVKSINVIKDKTDFPILELELSELIKNKNKYECLPVKVKNVEIINESFQNYTQIGDEQLMIAPLFGIQLPSKATLIGYYGDNDNVKGLVIPSEKQIFPIAYNSIYELKQTYSPIKMPLELTENAIVAGVKKTNDSTFLYLNQTNNYDEICGIVYKFEGTSIDIKPGDSISGIKGIYKAIITNDSKNIAYGSTMTANDYGKSINILNRGNSVNHIKVDDVAYLKSSSIINKEALLVITPSGKIIKNSIDGKYCYCLETEVYGKKDFVIVDGIDFSKYEGQNIAVKGIVDAGINTPGTICVLLRDENDIIQSVHHFATIKEMKEAGNPIATNTVYVLDNNVLVNFATSWLVQDELKMYGMYIQDETGALFVRSQHEINAATGDSITGISGSFIKSNKSGAYIEMPISDIKVISKGNKVDENPKEVTIKKLYENRDRFYGYVLKLTNVKHGSRVGGYAEDGPVYETYLYQDSTYSMPYSFWNYDLYEVNDIIGIFDDGGFAESFSFLPLSQDHIINSANTAVEEIKYIKNNIFVTKDGILHSDGASFIKIFNLNGNIVKQTTNDIIDLSNISNGCYIVISTYKNINKVSKIIL